EETLNGFYVTGDYIQIENVAITSFNIGFNVTGDNNTLDNIVFVKLGKGSDPGNGSNTGFGIRLIGDDNVARNSYGEDANAEAYKIQGSNNLIEFCVYRNTTSNNQTDYYFTIAKLDGTAQNNTIKNNRCYRYHNGSHTGHGYDIKGGKY